MYGHYRKQCTSRVWLMKGSLGVTSWVQSCLGQIWAENRLHDLFVVNKKILSFTLSNGTTYIPKHWWVCNDSPCVLYHITLISISSSQFQLLSPPSLFGSRAYTKKRIVLLIRFFLCFDWGLPQRNRCLTCFSIPYTKKDWYDTCTLSWSRLI